MTTLIQGKTGGFNGKIAVALTASALLAMGCTTHKTHDLGADRQQNMQGDIALWKQSHQPVPEQGLTLQEAIDLGLQNNLQLRAAAFERAMLDDNKRAEQLQMLPDLNFNATRYRRNNQPRQDFIRADTGEVTQSNVISAFRTGTRSQLELTWSVLDFGLSYVRSRQAGYESLAQQTRTARQAQLLALDITDAFWRSALAEDALDYLRTTKAQLGARKADLQSAVDAGIVGPYQTITVSQRLVDIEIAIRDLQAAVSNARIDLARLLGFPMNQQLQLVRGPIRPILSNLPRLNQLDSEALLRYALLNRPELYEADLNERIREDDVKAAMLSMFPDLTFGVGQFYDNNRLLRDNDWNRVSASVSWNLLDIPARLASRRGRENAVQMTRFQRLQTTAGVIAQVHLALLDYATKTDRFLLRDEAARLAGDMLNLSRGNHAAGEASVMEVSERELQSVTARMARDQAVVDVLVAYSRVLTSVGVDTALWQTQLTGICLPASEMFGACLAKPGQYTTLAQQDGGYSNEVTIAEVQTINRGSVAPAAIDTISYEGGTVSYSDSSTVAAYSDAADYGISAGQTWVVYVGAFQNPDAQQQRVNRASQIDPISFRQDNALLEPLDRNGTTLYRVGFAMHSRSEAYTACATLKNQQMDCWVSSKPAAVVAALTTASQ